MECPVCSEEFDSALSAWSAVECPSCDAVWIGLDDASRRVLVVPDEAIFTGMR
jgi:hypothetical protein